MLYIGKKPEKPNVGKIVFMISAAVAAVAALAVLAYKLYQKYVPACIDCECEDFLDDDDLPEDESIEVECDDGASENEFEGADEKIFHWRRGATAPARHHLSKMHPHTRP